MNTVAAQLSCLLPIQANACTADAYDDYDNNGDTKHNIGDDEEPERRLVDDFIALVLGDGEGPDLAYDPPDEHKEQKGAQQ